MIASQKLNTEALKFYKEKLREVRLTVASNSGRQREMGCSNPASPTFLSFHLTNRPLIRIGKLVEKEREGERARIYSLFDVLRD